jgi:type IV pilus assembly protein PilQ
MTNLKCNLKLCAVLVVILTVILALTVGCASKKSVTQDKSEGGSPSGPKLITEVIATEDADSYLILVKGNRQLTYTSVKQNLPLGVLFYFPETGIDETVQPTISSSNDIIDTIETSRISDKQNMSRLLIALKKDIPYDVTPEGAGIKISFAKTQTVSAAAETTTTEQPGLISAAAPAAVTAAPASRLKGIYIIKSKKFTKIMVDADGAIQDFKAFTLDKPARIVIDIPKVKSPFKGQQVLKVNTKWVTRVRHHGHPDKVRVVLDTQKPFLKTYTTVPVNNGLMILLGDAKPTAAEAEPAAVRAAGPPPAPASLEKTVEPEPAVSPAAVADTEKPAWINRIDFRSEEAGKSSLIIGTTRPVQYDLTGKADKLLHLKLYNTKLPKYRNRPLITTRFESAVNRITPIHKETMKDTSIVVIELRESVPYEVKQKDDQLLIRFAASSIPPKPVEQADLPSWKKVLAQTEAEAVPEKAPAALPPAKEIPATAAAPAVAAPAAAAPPAAAPAPSPEVVAPPPAALPPLTPPKPLQMATISPQSRPQYESLVGSSLLPRPIYTGEKIALDFFETDIKNVFRILREISGKNFAIDKNVTGSVTLTLEKPVPWDQVLDLILKMNRLGMTFEGDIVRIAPLSTLTAEQKARQAKFAAERKARQQVKDLEPLVTEYIPVNYSDARAEILPHIKPVLTKNRGKISVDQRNNQVIVIDTAAKLSQIKEIVSRIDTVTPQVIIEAKVVEVNNEFEIELGITWDMAWGPISTGSGDTTFDLSMNFPSEATSTAGFNFAKITGTPFLLDATLNAVEANKKGRIITAPKIVTLDNKKARIKQGVEWPYLERDSSGNATVKFKNIDLLLEVTPTVTPDDRILMKIFITKNDIGTITLGVPSLNTNEAQTELLVNDGDTIVIGGIIKKNEQNSVTGWPGLKDVPLLGWLFKTQKDTDTANELLIFITPRIVMLEQRRLL